LLDKEKRSLGVSQFRYNKEQFDYEGNDKSYKGKVFILIDELTGSSAEILAAGLQSNKRAIIVGQNSAGAVLPSTIELLPNGGGFQYVIADYKTPDGKVLEGKGVKPDVEVKMNRKDLLSGKDSVLETTLQLADKS
jgi:carboxyl-terminal processing protease